MAAVFCIGWHGASAIAGRVEEAGAAADVLARRLLTAALGALFLGVAILSSYLVRPDV
jgi:hypothetical protein